MVDVRYPIGQYEPPAVFTPALLSKYIDEIEALPDLVRAAVSGMSVAQLTTSYRTGGWTVRQVVHHLADSHMNAYIRTKLTLTEDKPTVKPYVEDKWGELYDSRMAPVNLSLDLLEGLHKRWGILLRAMKPAEFERAFFHPELKREILLNYLVGMYAWHGKHHLAHIKLVK